MSVIRSLLIVSLLSTANIFADNKCGYQSCDLGKPGVLNVHLIPHSHDDVGWLKTVDQYYYGYKDDIQGAGVQYVLDTVVRALNENPNRRFSYVEMAYFTRWWKDQKDDIKQMVQKLVGEGRLQFLLGGWTMNDEADTHYTAIIDQMTLGLDFLNQTFGECGRPLVAWQIDPFGHSIEQSNLFALMGFDANIFMRLDYREKDQRIQQLRMEFIQNTSFFRSPKTDTLFTSVLYDSYCPPSTFCFDDKCQDPPMMDDPTLQDFNVLQRVTDFANYVTQQSKAYTTNHILVPMGCDFQFQNAYHNFVNIDKLIYYVNLIRKDINVIYSTPACYIKAVNSAKKVYTVKFDDFFPYASGPNSFWTGYFTSRSALKGFIRKSNNLYQVCKQVQVVSMSNNRDSNEKIRLMSTKMGVLQHHDAVTGTEKQAVAYDYAQRLSEGWKACEDVLGKIISTLTGQQRDGVDFVTCSLNNISYCIPSDNINYTPLTMVLYNSLTTNYTQWCRLPVSVLHGDKYFVKDAIGNFVPSQLVQITERTINIPERPKNLSANYELIFSTKIPPMGYTSFIIYKEKNKSCKDESSAEFSTVKAIKGGDFHIENENLALYYSDNVLVNVLSVKTKIAVKLNQSMKYYYSRQDDGQSSGAYIFRPTTSEPISFNDSVAVLLINGSLVTEVHQVFSQWATLVTRLYKGCDKVESEWTVGPIPITKPSIGREVVLQYTTDLNNMNSFYTDSNSRQMIQRMINKRYDYFFNQTEPVAGNYYPIVSDVSIHDVTRSPNVGLIIHTDRSLGGGAYRNGMIETMLHRRTLRDDNFGVSEPLNETGSDGEGLIVRGKQWFSIGYSDDIIKNRRIENVKLFNRPIVLFAKNSRKSNSSSTNIKDFSALKMEIPKNLHITSMENHFTANYEVDYQIIRIENLYAFGPDPSSVDLSNIFNFITVSSIEELNLSANQFMKDFKRLQWTTKTRSDQGKRPESQGVVVSLLPNEIRTFKAIFKKY